MTGAELRAWRERHGWTQAEAAARLGTTRQRITENETREQVRPYLARGAVLIDRLAKAGLPTD